ALTTHADICEAVVLAREDMPGEKRLVAYLVNAPGAAPSISELREFLKPKLPEHMMPAAYVTLGALPLTENGKVDKKALSRMESPGMGEEEDGRGPGAEVEEVMAGIWRQTLRVEQVGTEDNFFELGGHSLLATRVISRVREVFKVELPLLAIFDER